MKRQIVAIFEIEDDNAINENMGTIDYFERECGWLEDSNIYIQNARVLDEDDSEDNETLNYLETIVF